MFLSVMVMFLSVMVLLLYPIASASLSVVTSPAIAYFQKLSRAESPMLLSYSLSCFYLIVCLSYLSSAEDEESVASDRKNLVLVLHWITRDLKKCLLNRVRERSVL